MLCQSRAYQGPGSLMSSDIHAMPLRNKVPWRIKTGAETHYRLAHKHPLFLHMYLNNLCAWPPLAYENVCDSGYLVEDKGVHNCVLLSRQKALVWPPLTTRNQDTPSWEGVLLIISNVGPLRWRTPLQWLRETWVELRFHYLQVLVVHDMPRDHTCMHAHRCTYVWCGREREGLVVQSLYWVQELFKWVSRREFYLLLLLLLCGTGD